MKDNWDYLFLFLDEFLSKCGGGEGRDFGVEFSKVLRDGRGFVEGLVK